MLTLNVELVLRRGEKKATGGVCILDVITAVAVEEAVDPVAVGEENMEEVVVVVIAMAEEGTNEIHTPEPAVIKTFTSKVQTNFFDILYQIYLMQYFLGHLTQFSLPIN